jgi:DNA-directed RNA polymerase subunit RPC12/RpoP
MPIKDKDRKARANYAAKVKTYRLPLFPNTDADIVAKLETVREQGENGGEGIAAYLRRLIREDMNKTAQEAEISLLFDDLGDDPINCPYCGLKLPQGVEICPACGKKIS